MKRCLAAIAIVAAFAPAACSSTTSGKPKVSTRETPAFATPSPSEKQYADIRALCTTIGYEFTEDTGEHELYTADQGECAQGQTIYWFSSTANPDKYPSLALQFGGAYVVGETWAVDAGDLTDAYALQTKIGGEVKS